MAGTNDFKAIATGGGANVITQSEFAALTSFLANGFSSGVVESDQFNKVLRQSSFIAAALGQLVADAGINAVDDGDVSGFVADLVSALHSFSPPPGTVVFVAQNTAPTGFLKANGAAVSRTTYASLFSAIGTIFGVGDGMTTFNVPDLRGEFLRGWDDSRGIDSARVFGSAQSDALKAHTHSVTEYRSTSFDDTGGTYPVMADTGGTTGSTRVIALSTGGSETCPRNIALLACIKY